MAEAVFRKLAGERLGCGEDRLLDHGIDVLSAGVAASDSSPASREAIEVLQDRDIDLSEHLSQQVTDEMLTRSDLILTMTGTHLGILQNARPDLSRRMRTLREDGHGISDPIGGSIEEYRDCAQEITRCVDGILNDIIRKDDSAK